MFRLNVPDGTHLVVATFSVRPDRELVGMAAISHPGVPIDYRQYRGAAGDPERCASFYDDLSHHARRAYVEWLDGLADVLGYKSALA